MTSNNPVDLDLLAETVGQVTVFGRTHDVRALDGASYRTLYEVESGENPDVRALYALIPRVAPTLTPEDVDRLNARQVGMILNVAGRTVKEVETQFPNSDGPTVTTTDAAAPA